MRYPTVLAVAAIVLVTAWFTAVITLACLTRF